MILFSLTLLYAGVVGLLMSVLSIRVPLRRAAVNTPFGDGGDVALATRIRAFGNFTEYVPMILILLGLLEAHGAPRWSLHALGAGLVASRVLHAVAYVARTELTTSEKAGRGLAAMSTWLLLTGAAAGATWLGATAL